MVIWKTSFAEGTLQAFKQKCWTYTVHATSDKKICYFFYVYQPWFCWAQICLIFANSVDADQLASEEANWSGSALFVMKYVNLYEQPGSSSLIGKTIFSAWEGL